MTTWSYMVLSKRDKNWQNWSIFSAFFRFAFLYGQWTVKLWANTNFAVILIVDISFRKGNCSTLQWSFWWANAQFFAKVWYCWVKLLKERSSFSCMSVDISIVQLHFRCVNLAMKLWNGWNYQQILIIFIYHC